MTIMYLTFGDKTEYHVQAYLSMLSFRKQLSPTDRLVMLTTRPQYYRKAAQWAEIVELDEQQVEAWKGPHQYMYRVKTMAMRQQAAEHPEDHLLFADTDTFLYGSLDAMRTLLDQGVALMHRDEGHPRSMKGPSLRMWKTVAGKTYAGITLGPEHNMWNSGIVGMPKEKMKAIADHTLQLLDGMLDDGVKSFNIEQFAMSVAMKEHAPLHNSTAYIGHYWGNKTAWEQLIHDLLLRAYMQDSSLEELLDVLGEELWQSLPIFVHQSNTARRLEKIINRLFPDRNPIYIKEFT